MGFSKLGLTGRVLEGVAAAGYTSPTTIQTLAIPPVLEGRDLIAGAQTGTGKTAAFVLPILERLAQSDGGAVPHKQPRVLVLAPTRELAQQVQRAAATYGRFLPLATAPVYGGVGMEAQVKQLRRGVDIVVATPGRLLDHMQQRSVDLSHIQILVLDEADRMLDMGFIRDVRRIIDALPKQRQTLLFSATISPDITALAADILRSPQTVEVGERRNPAESVTQHFYAVPRELKTDVLVHAMEAESMESVLVFSRTKHGADKITRKLARRGINAVAIHSNRTQGQRERALDGFKRGEFRVLVATDIAARGIHVTGISHVINYDVPQYAEDYIHRIGRTGRAGATGDAITFVSREERDPLHRIERFIGRKFPVDPYPGAPTAPSTPREADGAHAGPGRAEQRGAPGHRREAVQGGDRRQQGSRTGRGERSRGGERPQPGAPIRREEAKGDLGRAEHGERAPRDEQSPGGGKARQGRQTRHGDGAQHVTRTQSDGSVHPGRRGSGGSDEISRGGRPGGEGRAPQGAPRPSNRAGAAGEKGGQTRAEAGRRRAKTPSGKRRQERKSASESWSNYPRHTRGRRF
jgi:ATP-dependent RNA helicase RhlE